MLQTRVHPSQQKFFDLLGELKFRAIFLFALGVTVMTVFLFEMSAMYALIVLFFRLGYQLIFLIGLAGNFQSKVLFEKKESEKLGETTVLQNRLHPSQQKIFDLLGTHCPPPSPVSPLFIRPSLDMQLLGIQ